jgi:hypothetical protein
MAKPIRFAQLSSARPALVPVFHSTSYGSIRLLKFAMASHFRSGTGPNAIIDIRLDSEELARDELALADFARCADVCRLMSSWTKSETQESRKSRRAWVSRAGSRNG